MHPHALPLRGPPSPAPQAAAGRVSHGRAPALWGCSLPRWGPRSPTVSGQAFVISFTSDFIPRLVYLYTYSENGTMHGFVNHTLSSFNVSDFQDGTAPSDPLGLGYEVQICRYRIGGDVPRFQPGFLQEQGTEQLDLVLGGRGETIPGVRPGSN